eukprot:scaffold10302_cov118-Cylindrotheca_fusiformis.AAC.4
MEELELEYQQACSNHRRALEKFERLQLKLVRAKRDVEDKARVREETFAKLTRTSAGNTQKEEEEEDGPISMEFQVGQRMEKEFGGVVYQGSIVEVPSQHDDDDDEPCWCYHIRYDDGDEEEIPISEMYKYVVDSENRDVPSLQWQQLRTTLASVVVTPPPKNRKRKRPPASPTGNPTTTTTAILTAPIADTTEHSKRQKSSATKKKSGKKPATKNRKPTTTNSKSGSQEKNVPFVPEEDDPDWLEEMDYFLQHVPHGRNQSTCSGKNTKMVIRQVRKLATGKGVGYQHWPDDVKFMENKRVTLEDNFEELGTLAKVYEVKYGQDKGHGWLLGHPLKKMACFKEYLDRKKKSPTRIVADDEED